jgi:hypothetical protein
VEARAHSIEAWAVSEPIEGWRAWRLLRRADGAIRLGPLFSPDERWIPRSAARALCAVEASFHAAPSLECRCGYYAYTDASRLGGATRRSAVIGRVAMWGAVIGHEFGYRAEYAYPQRLRLVCGPCLRAGRDRSPRWVIERRGEMHPVCDRHAPRLARRGSRTQAERVESELLEVYGVEVMPGTGLAPPPTRRAALAVGRALAARTRFGLVLGAILIVSLLVGVALRYASREGASPPAEAGAAVSSSTGEAYDTASGVQFRHACGAGPASDIRVVRCSSAPKWASIAVFRPRIQPKCFGAVIQTMPGGRTRCWVRVDSEA